MARTELSLDEETKKQGHKQAKKLGLTFTAYVSLIIKLDVMTDIVKKLNEEKS